MSMLYRGIELDGLEKDTKMFHSIAMHSIGADPNIGTEYLDKLCEYKRADLPQAQFDEINKLWSVVKMNYQICNGGIYQYFMNGYHEHHLSADKEVEIFDKDTQVQMLRKLHDFACEVLPERSAENSKFARIVDFFDSLEYEENVPQYGEVDCGEEKQIWDDETEEWVDNPDYEEPYEDIVDYEDEVRSTSYFDADRFDNEYYEINSYIEKVVEIYAQFVEKSIAKELSIGVDSLITSATDRARENGAGKDTDVKELD